MSLPIPGGMMLAPPGAQQPAFLSLVSLFARKNGAPVSGTDGGVFIIDTSGAGQGGPPVVWFNATAASGDTSAVNSAWQSLQTGQTN